jgi:hypothetical protein
MRTARLVGALLVVLMVSSVAVAVPTYQRLEVAGVAQVLQTNGASGGGYIAYNTTTNRIHWQISTPSYVNYFQWHDASLYGNLGGTHVSLTGSPRHDTSGHDFYKGTVTGNDDETHSHGSAGLTYVPDANAVFNHTYAGNGGTIEEYQAASTDTFVDTVGEGTVGSPVNTARIRSNGSPLTTGQYRRGLTYLDTDSGNYRFLTINNRNGSSQQGTIFSLEETPDPLPGATTVGTRVLSGLSANAITAAELDSLVPGTSTDWVRDLATDANGTVYAVSADGTNNYLSAFTFDGSTFTALWSMDLVGLIRDDADSINVAAVGIAVNADGSTIYISTDDNVFIFEQVLPVAEPAGLSLMGLALLGLKKKRSRSQASAYRRSRGVVGLAGKSGIHPPSSR